MRVGIVGCGLIGKRRAAIVEDSPEDELVIVADIDGACADGLANASGCCSTIDYRDVVSRDDIDAVVVATTNKFLMPVTVAALRKGKHVLCEKPLGRDLVEAQQMVEAARIANRVLKVGFNHRYHPALLKAHDLCSQGALGSLYFIRAMYGHGGRPGYDREWRGDPDLAGGGEMLDQGIHVIDLCLWFLGKFTRAYATVSTYFWDLGYFDGGTGDGPGSTDGDRASTGRRLEDNAFALLHTEDGCIAQFHTSWTQWKNRFRFEIFGHSGYLIVEGLGGSYGVERLTLGKRQPQSGPPEETTWEFPGPDRSWELEWKDFTTAIHQGRQPLGNADDGLEAMIVVDALYGSARIGTEVRIPGESFCPALTMSGCPA